MPGISCLYLASQVHGYVLRPLHYVYLGSSIACAGAPNTLTIDGLGPHSEGCTDAPMDLRTSLL